MVRRLERMCYRGRGPVLMVEDNDKKREEIIDFLANRTDAETERRIVRELGDPDSFASKFIDRFRSQVIHAVERVDWPGLAQVLFQDEPAPQAREPSSSAGAL